MRAKTADFRAGDSRPEPAPTIRAAAFEDHARIAAVQERNGLVPLPRAEWEALWTRNPVYQRLGGRWPIGWVLETETGEITGAIGNIPLEYRFGGRTLLASSPYGWAVDTTHRRHSLRILNSLTRQPGIDLIICTTVGPASEPIWRLLQLRAPVGTWNRSDFWITGHRGFMRSTLRMRRIPFAPALSGPLGLALFCRDALRKSGIPSLARQTEIEVCAGFDVRFDAFWERLTAEKPGVLLGVRTRETLAWHFQSALAKGTLRILALIRNSELAAYAVFDRLDRPDLQMRRARLVDFQALDGFEWAIGPLLRRRLEQCRREGIHVLENVGLWLDRPDLPRIRAPYQRALPAWSFYYKATDSALGEALKNPAAWVASAYDGDSSL